jgi:hypothetical protein
MKVKALIAWLGAAAVALLIAAPSVSAAEADAGASPHGDGTVLGSIAPQPLSALDGPQPALTVRVATDPTGEATRAGAIQPMSYAPTCVWLSQWASGAWDYARATNHCGYTVRIKMNWAWAIDGSCKTLRPGWYYTESRLRPGHYVQALENC